MEFFDNSFYAFVALVIFLGLMVYFGLPRIVSNLLDKRIQQISDELALAKRLREEAAALLVEYEQKRLAAEAEAEGIIAAAKEEAVRMTNAAQVSLSEMIERRTKSVQDKIAQAEAQAVAEVRARSADVAIEAARLVLTEEMNNKGGQVVDKAIADVGSRLN